jgi:hypothetical protein
MRFSFWIIWMKLAGFGLVLFGLGMTFFNATPVFDLFNQGIDPVFWTGGQLELGSLSFRTWVYGAWGATIAGWGVSLLFLVYNAFAKRERWSWFAISNGLGLWYLLDTGISAYFNVNINVIFNSFILGLLAVPLIGSYRFFRA